MISEHFWENPPEIDEYVPGASLEEDVVALLACLTRFLNDECSKNELQEAMEAVYPWLAEHTDDPQANGWVGRNGLP